MKTVVALTGASGVIYGIELLRHLSHEKYLIISEHAAEVIEHETVFSVAELKKLAHRVFRNDELTAPIASGSTRFDNMVIVPCSLSTLSKIACGIADNLITRVASICLKEHRKLVLVPRETPLSAVHLKNMYELAAIGVTILPAMPAFYSQPEKIEDLIHFVVGKILETLGLNHDLYPVWKGVRGSARKRSDPI